MSSDGTNVNAITRQVQRAALPLTRGREVFSVRTVQNGSADENSP